MKLKPIEQLAIAQAIQKRVGEFVETGNPDNLRGKVDAEMKKRYESDPMAAKSYDVKLFGEKVGTYSLTVAKPRKQEVRKSFCVKDNKAFWEWCIREGFIDIDMKSVLEHFRKCGEVPDGCEPMEEVIVGDAGGYVTKTTLRIEPEKVSETLGSFAAEPLVKMLDGSFNELEEENA